MIQPSLYHYKLILLGPFLWMTEFLAKHPATTNRVLWFLSYDPPAGPQQRSCWLWRSLAITSSRSQGSRWYHRSPSWMYNDQRWWREPVILEPKVRREHTGQAYSNSTLLRVQPDQVGTSIKCCDFDVWHDSHHWPILRPFQPPYLRSIAKLHASAQTNCDDKLAAKLIKTSWQPFLLSSRILLFASPRTFEAVRPSWTRSPPKGWG